MSEEWAVKTFFLQSTECSFFCPQPIAYLAVIGLFVSKLPYLRGQWHCFAAFAAALPVVISSVQWAICDNVRVIEWKPLMKHLAGLLVDHTLGGSIMYCGWSCCEGIDGFRGGRRGPASRFCRRAVWVLPRVHMVNWQHGRVNGHYHHHRMS